MHGSKICLLSMLLLAAPAWSQTPDYHGAPRSEFSLYGGYSLMVPNVFKGADGAFGGESGWNAGVDIAITRNVGAAVDFSQYFSNYGLGANTTPFIVMVGPRLWAPVRATSKVRPFADFLMGGGFIQTGRTNAPALFNSSTTFAWNAGGGVDIRAANHLWFRGQAGYLHTAFTTWDTEVQQYTPKGHARVILGILYRR